VTKSENFQLFKLFPYYSLLSVPDICFNLCNTHQKTNFHTLFLYAEK